MFFEISGNGELPPTTINTINSYCDNNQNYQESVTNKYQKNKEDLSLSAPSKTNPNNSMSFNINRKYLDKNVIIYQPIMTTTEGHCQHSKALSTDMQPQTMLNISSATSSNHINFVESNHMPHSIPNTSFEAYSAQLRNHDNFKLNFKQEPDSEISFTS
jgi:hypothetical protein